MGSSSSKATQEPLGKIVIGAHQGSSPNRRQNGSVNVQDSVKNNNVVQRGGKSPKDTTPTNTLFEEVFYVTLGIAVGNDLPEFCVHTKETFGKYQKDPMLTVENIEESVLERSEMANPRVHLLKSKSPGQSDKSSLNAHERMTLRYLYQSYLRLKACETCNKYTSMKDELQKCKEVIFLQTKRCLTFPDNYKQQSVQNQFIDLAIEHAEFLLDKDKSFNEFIIGAVDEFDKEKDENGCKAAFDPVLANLQNRFAKEYNLSHTEISPCVKVVELFSCHRLLAEVFLSFNTPTDHKDPRRYEKTLIGALLSLSSCPKKANGPFEFYKEPLGQSQQDINATQLFIWQQLGVTCDGIYRTLFNIVKINEDLRHRVLHWFGCCLETLRGKPELWSAHEVQVFDQTFCSDGFCLNLSTVLLYFCRPFAEPDSEKLTRIKPSYCKVVPKMEEDEKFYCVHARGLHKEETFVPSNEESKKDSKKEYKPDKPYPFISECYFLTQQALFVSYSIVHKMVKLNNNVNRLDKLYNDMKDVYPRKFTEMIKTQLNTELCWYLNIKASMSEYHLTKMCLQFHTASASWLAQTAVQGNIKAIEPIKFPLPSVVPEELSQVPQMVMVNISNYMTTLLLFRNVEFLKSKPENFKHLLTMIIVFMGSPSRLKNPDIRAELAETLEIVLPKFNQDGSWDITPRDEALFTDHPLVDHLAETVLNVFVTIEMTGQNVDAEKKFNYRKSMHKTLQFMWKIPRHRMAIKALADAAMKQIDDADPPLFLRFINLLVNDAIFLLDEALDHMKQIKDTEQERDTGAWNNLTSEQLRDKETGLRYLSMIGKHRNIMANYTIYTLEIITRDIRDIFCHPVMVDRIASMLNYFFLHLVGPKQKDYKVRDRKELEFKPEQVVSDIAHMYLYLGKNDNFCKAVIGETRSFSHDVFQRALVVLKKIGLMPEFVEKFEEYCKKLEIMGEDQQKEEELVADAPDEFLDPIMGTLMTDPVILPTSHKTLDKEVIRRHLLSDQCDPYNRQPLTFDMVIPNTELKEKIQQWLKEQKSKPQKESPAINAQESQ